MRNCPPAFTLLFFAAFFATPVISAHAATPFAKTINSNAEGSVGTGRAASHYSSAVQVTITNAVCTDSGSVTFQQSGAGLCSYALVDSSKATIANGVLNGEQSVTIPVVSGTYTVNLNDSATGTILETVTVTGATMAPPVADFQVTAGNSLVAINQAQVGERVVVTASIGNPATYMWAFGNGTFSSEGVTSTVYNTAGQYLISLVTENAVGCTTTMQQTITITGAPAAIQNVADNGGPAIWSDNSMVYVDLRNTADINATINIYDILGRQLSSERSGQQLYKWQVNNIEAGYFIVSVAGDKKVTTKKVFIANIK